MHISVQRYPIFVALIAVGSFVGASLWPAPAIASDTPEGKAKVAAASAAPGAASTARAQEITDLKADLAAMKQKLDLLESQQEQQAVNSLEQLRKQEAAAAKAKASAPSGSGVKIVESSGTDVRLYGLIEATLAGITKTTSKGASSIGLPVAWFSGNRWGFDVKQKLWKGEGKQPDNAFDVIMKLESEYELASGNQDTPGVLFNRDAWLGIESKAFGKLTIGRQNALPRDVAQIWGDPYGASAISTGEGGFSNTNNFKQFIFYASGGNGANGQGDTRYDAAIVWKKLWPSGLFLSAAYDFGDANGPGGPNGSGPVPGAQFNKGSAVTGGIGYNGKYFHTTAFYTTSNVFEPKTIGDTNVAHQDQSVGIGGNYDWGKFRVNAGYMYYTGEQGTLGHRYDKAWSISAKLAPTKLVDYELGLQEFYAQNAAVNGSGAVLRPFKDASSAKRTINGSRFTVYGSIIAHPIPNVDIYVAGDDLLTGGGYLDSRANGFQHVNEFATGMRYKF